MVKFLGIVDLFAALALLSIMGEVVHVGAFSFLIVFLLIKTGFFWFDMGGFIDLMVAVLIFLSFFFTPPYLALLIGSILMGLKGIVSMAS